MNSATSLIGLLFFLIMISSYGQTSSSSDGNWSSGGNWTSGVPTTDEVATISNDMTIDQDIEIDTDGSYTVTGSAIDPSGGSDYSLTVQGEGYLEIDGDVTFGGNLNLKNNAEIVVKGCDTLTIGGNAVLENNSDMTIESCAVLIIKGNLEMKNNLGMTINGQVKIEGDLTASNNASASGTGNVQVDGTTDFSNGSNLFGDSGGCTDCDYGGGSPLPIELTRFSGQFISSNQIEVNWETASEINNDYFTVDYSFDQQNYDQLGVVRGAGNSYSTLVYKEVFLFNSTTSEVYIRLKQTDFDGQYEYSEVVLVKPFLDRKKRSFVLSNNPGNGLNVKVIFEQQLSDFELLIRDISGKIIYHKAYHDLVGINTPIELPDLSNKGKGVYFVQVRSQSQLEQEILIVQ